jgi:hypothetical protein
MGDLLDEIGHLLMRFEGDWGEPIPQIQSLVVLKRGKFRGLPSDGIEEFWPSYPYMSLTEKARRTQAEFDKVALFGSRWNEVLSRLGVPEIKEVPTTQKPSNQPHGAGGESIAHLAMKKFIKENPRLIGAEADWQSFLEYPLSSGDVVDVFFKSNDACIAVEVKSRTSDENIFDYERGVFQTVKYASVLKAMSETGSDVPKNIKVILAIETALPGKFRGTAKTLGVVLLEEVNRLGLYSTSHEAARFNDTDTMTVGNWSPFWSAP